MEQIRPFRVAGIIFTLAISSVLGAPQSSIQQPQIQSQAQPPISSNNQQVPSLQPANKLSIQSTNQLQPTAKIAAPLAPNSSQSSLISSVPLGSSISQNGPSRSSSSQQVASSSDTLDNDIFDGKNLFNDDSLWNIPIHLNREISAMENQKPLNAPLAVSSDQSRSSANLGSLFRGPINDESDADDDDSSDADEPISSLPAPMTSAVGQQSASSPLQSSSSSPTVISATTDLKTSAGYHYPTHEGHHGYAPSYNHHSNDYHGGKYFQYASVPYPHAWEFGYRRGNPYHTIERYEHGKGPHFQTKVKWSDKYGGYGVHVWDYNHDDHHGHHYGHGGHAHYDSHGPSHGGHHYGGGHYGHH